MSDYLFIAMIIFFLAALFIMIGLKYSSFFIIILFAMFLENSVFQIPESQTMPFNIRPVYMIFFISLFYLIPQLWLKFSSDLKFLFHHKLLLIYYAYFSIILLTNPHYNAIEHFGQISIGIFLYFVFVILVRKQDFDFLYKIFLLIGFLQIILGVIQVFLGILTVETGLSFKEYLQHLDLVRYGRPFGTFIEPDFYGVFSSLFALVFLGEYLKTKKNIYYFLSLLSTILLFYGAVKGAIIGFIFSIFIFIYLLKDYIKISKIDFITSLYIFIFSIPIFYGTIERFSYLFRLDFWVEGIMNPRILQTSVSFSQFLESPIFGNGLNSYRFLGDTYSSAVEDWMPDWVISGYDPSIVTSLLNDTGIIGFILFSIFLIYFFKNIFPLSKNSFRKLGLFFGVLSLFISYLFTNGLPFTFTWIIIAMVELNTKFK